MEDFLNTPKIFDIDIQVFKLSNSYLKLKLLD